MDHTKQRVHAQFEIGRFSNSHIILVSVDHGKLSPLDTAMALAKLGEKLVEGWEAVSAGRPLTEVPAVEFET